MRLADTHVHIWDFNRAEYRLESLYILNRNYSIEELQAERLEAGIKKILTRPIILKTLIGCCISC
jgi:predicted TIM-barrel fold metal-dependent hydrolase